MVRINAGMRDSVVISLAKEMIQLPRKKCNGREALSSCSIEWVQHPILSTSGNDRYPAVLVLANTNMEIGHERVNDSIRNALQH